MGHEEFKLNTDAIANVEVSVQKLVDQLENLKKNVDDYKANMLKDWVGEGRNEFEKTYNIISRKFTDQIDCAWDLYEELITAHEAYIQTDVDLAKTEEGVTKYDVFDKADAADSIADRCGPLHRAGRNQGGGRGGA